MPGCPSSRNSIKPQLFFTLCFLFSFVIVIFTAFFLYDPDRVTKSGILHGNNPLHNNGKEEESKRVHESLQQDPRDEENHGTDGAVQAALTVMERVQTETKDAIGVSDQLRIRHHAHHHDHQKLLEEFEQKSHISDVIESRILHLDLKGAPPKLAYLKEVLHLAKKAGITGVLLEWEDTFPWSNSLRNLSLTKGGYSKEEATELINYAELLLDLEVIPLVQTFGHVEFVLKTEEFCHLREVDDPQSFCPSKAETITVIKEMIDQILSFHTRSRFVHIGCDEVFSLRLCPICTKAFEHKEDLFLHHVVEVATYVRSKDRIPIIWDDMLRSIPMKKLNESGIGNIVEPMVWVYAEDVDRFVGWEAWQKYSEIFPTVWGAAAFKGAFGETLMIPPLSRHAHNVEKWINVIARESMRWDLGVGGLVLTGWMRYDHFAVLCELLPAGIPSLVYNALQLSIPNSSVVVIKNRIFESPYEEMPIFSSSSPMPELEDYNYTQSPQPSFVNSQLLSSSPPAVEFKVNHVAKRSPAYRRKISHPRILMAKERLSYLSARSQVHTSTRSSSRPKLDQLTHHFQQILHCPPSQSRLDSLIKTDGELNFASRCNFPGVAFFRALFRLKGLTDEGWELAEKIKRERGWLTQYNIRHNYSLPLRVDEVTAEVPRLRKQIEVSVKGIETGLSPIFHEDVILEWIEQNVWEIWKTLKNLEETAFRLKKIGVWKRRPLEPNANMVTELGLKGEL